jgi:DNA-binding transcriptional LysR family regulator
MHRVFDWNDARYFLAIARGRTLSAAGRSLKVQQSTVGRRLAALEDALGARPVRAHPEGYLLTGAGEAMLAHAERIEDEALSAERSLLGREGRIAGEVRVTAPQAFGTSSWRRSWLGCTPSSPRSWSSWWPTTPTSA